MQVKLKDAAMCTLSYARGHLTMRKLGGRTRTSSLPYLAPELLQGHRPRKAADAYAFGLLMWEVCTGEGIEKEKLTPLGVR